MAILSFSDKQTETFFRTGETGKSGWSNVSSVAKRKLDMLNAAHFLSDLKAPPNNKLEALKKDLKGLHSIRISGQWRVVFKWTASGPTDVRICDYH